MNQMTEVTQSHTASFGSEQTLGSPELAAFWQGIDSDFLKLDDKLHLAYMSISHPQSKGTLVISNGRVESYVKYQELIFDCYRQGYSIYALDHRGQGLSSRLTSNPHKGHVEHFDDYVNDLALFIDLVVLPAQTPGTALFLIGHSMGSAIATLYLERHPGVFKAAVLCAPMYGIQLPMGKGFIRWLANKLDGVRQNGEPSYVPRGKDYVAVPFAENELTHSEIRYQAYRRLYQTQPELQLGAPTNHWLVQAIDAGDRCIRAARQSKTPILILQASEDTVVDNAAQNLAIGPNCRLLTIEGARHEIFIESDKIRDLALEALFDFLKCHAPMNTRAIDA
ncbi:alpha/beta fold hydrolase [Shewanella sp. AS16]|uniref:alpha/beta fold hydrolase n=1 Tax=Shewanella sp. AS16 TaxID=2907625 RepID=UPI001F245E13|nr:alpha/beta fold hydrolase [Shewanella sp. AS16]MCE9686253.1 alpha/beta fold hydrolase [Shewanella sp. AS16]